MPIGMVFKGEKNAFLRNTANKHRVINVTLTELIKPECNAFLLNYVTVIGTTKCSMFLEMSYNYKLVKDLLVLLL